MEEDTFDEQLESTQDEVLFEDAAPSGRTGGDRSMAPAQLALYRRYRPDTFADVIGQEHVTEPLQRALTNNRVNHAYLFSGPRGCGKTTSARILARALNCEKAPAPEPCGVCDSCRDLARGGPGSIDVIEIDAASHGGVDDARDLRERAFFAPVNSRYKIYIVDEAHMVTTAGFNALLKLVEEPPPHVKFIFATTEPEKVIGTIRSRTHHYPFRLVPPKVLGAYLSKLCDAEGIEVEPAVLPLVVRAGAGSVRDSLSVLDQLLGGAAETGVSYRQATALLGYTPDSLLDEFLDAFAAGDAGGVFSCVDKVIEVGQDPRRFGEDLLRRLRDLVIVAAVPDAFSSGLVDVAGDQAERLSSQAAALGAGELTRAAEVIALGLTDMRGTTAPRLHLELMCARVLLPGADVDERGVHARLDRLERRIGMSGAGAVEGVTAAPVGVALTEPAPVRPAEPDPVSEPRRLHAVESPQESPRTSAPAGPERTQSSSGSVQAPSGGPSRTEDAPQQGAGYAQGTSRARGGDPQPGSASQEITSPQGSPHREEAPAGAGSETREPVQHPDRSRQPGDRAPGTGALPPEDPKPAPSAPSLSVTDVRRLWPEVLEEVKGKRRFTWILLSQNAHVTEVRNGVLVLAMPNAGARDSFAKGGSEDILREALVVVLGADLRIEAMVDSSTTPTPAAPAVNQPRAQTTPERAAASWGTDPVPAERPAPSATAPGAQAPAGPSSAAPSPARPAPSVRRDPPPWDVPPDDGPPPPPEDEGEARSAPVQTPPSVDPAIRERARQGIRPTRGGGREDNGEDVRDAAAKRDDLVLEESTESHTELLARHLGAEIIAEENHGA